MSYPTTAAALVRGQDPCQGHARDPSQGPAHDPGQGRCLDRGLGLDPCQGREVDQGREAHRRDLGRDPGQGEGLGQDRDPGRQPEVKVTEALDLDRGRRAPQGLVPPWGVELAQGAAANLRRVLLTRPVEMRAIDWWIYKTWKKL
jgi:hypothetical protein